MLLICGDAYKTSSLCIHWVIPSHPWHVIFQLVWLGPGAAMFDTGYENWLVKDKRRLALGTFYHQLHHRYTALRFNRINFWRVERTCRHGLDRVPQGTPKRSGSTFKRYEKIVPGH